LSSLTVKGLIRIVGVSFVRKNILHSILFKTILLYSVTDRNWNGQYCCKCKNDMRAVWKVRGLTLLLQVGTLRRRS